MDNLDIRLLWFFFLQWRCSLFTERIFVIFVLLRVETAKSWPTLLERLSSQCALILKTTLLTSGIPRAGFVPLAVVTFQIGNQLKRWQKVGCFHYLSNLKPQSVSKPIDGNTLPQQRHKLGIYFGSVLKPFEDGLFIQCHKVLEQLKKIKKK